MKAPDFERPPQRIVSLVPSLTEALFALDLGDRVVGVTEWCVHPSEGVASLPRVGGTKDADVAAILRLSPDLVIANREENTRRVVERIEAAGVPVWVTYPRTVPEGAALLRQLAALGAPPDAVARVVEPVEHAVAHAQSNRSLDSVRVFCPIWRDPWMSVGFDTYANALLELCGGTNVFEDRKDRRYPRVEMAEIEAARPEVVLLPDEPYAFGPRDVAELRALSMPAAEEDRIHLIDGTWVSWYGPRIRRALAEVRALLH